MDDEVDAALNRQHWHFVRGHNRRPIQSQSNRQPSTTVNTSKDVNERLRNVSSVHAKTSAVPLQKHHEHGQVAVQSTYSLLSTSHGLEIAGREAGLQKSSRNERERETIVVR
jgi:hypothetical protein